VHPRTINARKEDMNILLLVLTLPFLTPERYEQAKVNNERIEIVFTMTGCPPCEAIKQEFKGRPGLFQLRNDSPLFPRFQNQVKGFPSLGVLRGKKVYIYKSSTRVREYFFLNPR
jgi:hypothetical protein